MLRFESVLGNKFAQWLKWWLNCLRQVNNKVSLHRTTQRHGKNTTKSKVGNLLLTGQIRLQILQQLLGGSERKASDSSCNLYFNFFFFFTPLYKIVALSGDLNVGSCLNAALLSRLAVLLTALQQISGFLSYHSEEPWSGSFPLLHNAML